jgi:hypothetical protein
MRIGRYHDIATRYFVCAGLSNELYHRALLLRQDRLQRQRRWPLNNLSFGIVPAAMAGTLEFE